VLKRALVTFAVFTVLLSMYIFLQMRLPLDLIDSPLMVEIKRGMSFKQTVKLLSERGLIRDPRVFIALARVTGLHKKVPSGRYAFEGNINPLDVFKKLEKGDTTPWEITIVEGDNIEQIKEKLLKESIITEDDFDRTVRDPAFMNEMGVDAPSLEGYLFPDTYRISAGMSAKDILGMMIKRLKEKYDEQLAQRAEQLGLDEKSVLTLASIIEKEAAVDDERPIISAVYHNRLRARIPLQADPTAVYGIKQMSEGVLRKDVERRTPYNTYHFRGLPPGPISSPGIKSIRAALYPADVPYLYFVSNNNGTHKFSRTLKEHQRAVNELRKIKNGKRDEG
jgi:UPF0755 protein